MRAAKNIHNNTSHKMVTFNLKITPQEKEKIVTFADRKGKPASKAIMELISREVAEMKPVKKESRRITSGDLIRMPRKERSLILKAQAKLAAKDYEIIEDGCDIVEY
jgi:hypothetical protein